ncbi:hypothetical protein [Pseudomonas sp. TWP3-2]|uniref:hypothetical protein n=1 Tax=Pseudomonas sp. TWP3-2 TaxID=2804574 RepID=UPI003CFAA583
MLTRNWPRHLLCLSLSLPLGSALACGPDFPARLLDNRGQTMSELPAGNFNFEINRLGKSIAGLKNLTPDADSPGTLYAEPSEPAEQRDKAEMSGLSGPQQALVQSLRGLSDAREAFAQGSNLPAEIRLYVAGAVAFNAGDQQLAVEYFRQLLALPAEQRPLRSTWAAYSAGRALYAMSAEANDRLEPLEEAIAAFRQARQLSIDGFSDPLGLGVASLGEEARAERFAGGWDRAIELYAAQSVHGSMVGYTSLKQLANELAEMPEPELAKLMQHEGVQKLLTAYLVSRLGWSYGEEPPSEKKLVKLLQNSTRGSLDNADRLAAMNYRQGDYASAKGFLEHAGDSGLAWWLRAKLAVRDGDKSAAAAAYAKAAQAFPQGESWGEQRTSNWELESVRPKCRVEAESAILALQRGEYIQAFDQLYRSQSMYWLDAATVAERVLTLDELKQYVDKRVPAVRTEESEAVQSATRLRNLLGRRLLREGQYAEAVGYFDSEGLQSTARQYGDLRRAADSAWWPTKRASALFNAAVIARESGIDILSYEMDPDYALLGGSYQLQTTALEVGPLVSEAEVQRQKASEAQPDQRYHYRFVATALANRAADNLPHSSQAFAAVLCTAVSWNSSLEDQSALYRRYVNEGAFVWWAEDFGRQCESPDFANADKRYVTQVTDSVRSTLRPYKWPVQIAAFVVVAGIAFMLFNRRQRKLRKT